MDKRFIFEPTSLDSAAHHRIHVNVRSLDANRQEKKYDPSIAIIIADVFNLFMMSC